MPAFLLVNGRVVKLRMPGTICLTTYMAIQCNSLDICHELHISKALCIAGLFEVIR